MRCRLFIPAALLGANVALAVSWFGPRPRPDPKLLLDDSVAAALRALGREELREPGSRPYAHLPEGTDTLPGIEHIVVLMMENHSFDNIFGMLGRGDGFTLDRYGKPINTNSYPNGTVQHAFPMPNTCQLPSQPSQEWSAGHNAFDNGTNSGFVSTPISQGDSLIAGTSDGLTDNSVGFVTISSPKAGTIFNMLDKHNITWKNYASEFPLGASPELFIADDGVTELIHVRNISQFMSDAASGSLPSFSFVEPDYSTTSQENPQNVAVGEAFMADIINAVGHSPSWSKTLFILNYDEWGGYYDHVVPPPALRPDNLPPILAPEELPYEGFQRYGFRVPSVVVSPYSKRDYVSHKVYDHTSVLAFLEIKFNLPALTYRDANANDLTDFLDLDALRRQNPTFPTFPKLAAPANTSAALGCSTTGPGVIPPPGSLGHRA